ncbi:hypothetical protein MBLNU230_g0832t1 [Neophaeotheca triangularis]
MACEDPTPDKRGSGCREECLRRIAARLCLLGEHAPAPFDIGSDFGIASSGNTVGTASGVVDDTEGPSGCCKPKPKMSGCAIPSGDLPVAMQSHDCSASAAPVTQSEEQELKDCCSTSRPSDSNVNGCNKTSVGHDGLGRVCPDQSCATKDPSPCRKAKQNPSDRVASSDCSPVASKDSDCCQKKEPQINAAPASAGLGARSCEPSRKEPSTCCKSEGRGSEAVPDLNYSPTETKPGCCSSDEGLPAAMNDKATGAELAKNDCCGSNEACDQGTALETKPSDAGIVKDKCCIVLDEKELQDEECRDDCCGQVEDTNDKSPSSACGSHLLAAFERFEALIRRGQCICRRAVEEFGFCCCTLSSNGSLPISGACADHRASTTARTTKGETRDKKRFLSSRELDVGRTSGCCAKPKLSSEAKTVSTITSAPYPPKIPTSNTGGHCSDRSTTQDVHNKTGSVADVENDAGREQVVLNVSGMTCTGCSTKVQNVLQQIPGVGKYEVTFVLGTASFELDSKVARADEVVALLERRTGFKCERLIEDHQHLDVLMDHHVAKQLEESGTQGIVSITKAKGNVYRVTYNPYIVGARDLMPPGAVLAPPMADPSARESTKRLVQMTWFFAIALLLTVPVVVLAWAPTPVPRHTRGVISLILATFVQAIAVPEFYTQAIKSLVFSRVIEMDMLVVVSITAAYAYSVVAFALAEVGIELEHEAFFETSTLLITLVLFGRLVAAYARTRATRAVSLRSLQAEKSVLLLSEGSTLEIDSRLLQYGDSIVIRAHAHVVTDGIVASGVSAVDESLLTGEALPITKREGDAVTAGTTNGEGILHVKITRLPGANSISDIAKSVENALSAKPRVQDLADKVASWFVPTVLVIATVVFAIWIAVALRVRGEATGGAIGTAITYAIAVLAVSCPCALGLAVPMVLVIAGGVAAKMGVIIKASDATERAYKVTTVIFDKTGTLTKGGLCVVREELLSDEVTDDEANTVAHSLVKDDTHPVAKGVAAHLAHVVSKSVTLDCVKSVPGSGIQAKWNGRTVKAGNPFWLSLEHYPAVSELLDQGLTCFCLSIDDKPTLAIGMEATLRSEAKQVIATLHKRNIATHIVSGDHTRAVAAAARALDVEPTNIASHRSPQQKKEYVEALQANGKIVLMCGDGTNDAVALAQANVGAQLGTSSDIASAVADVVLLRGLEGVPVLLDVSKQAFARIVFNFVWSAVYNVFAILLAAGAFVKVRIPPAYAGLGEIVSVGPVILAALTLMMGMGARE